MKDKIITIDLNELLQKKHDSTEKKYAKIIEERKNEIVEALQDVNYSIRGIRFTEEQWDEIRIALDEVGDAIP